MGEIENLRQRVAELEAARQKRPGPKPRKRSDAGGRLVARACRLLGLSQRELADRIGCARETLSREHLCARLQDRIRAEIERAKESSH